LEKEKEFYGTTISIKKEKKEKDQQETFSIVSTSDKNQKIERKSQQLEENQKEI
jgi:hypothetical protein